jgi:hypothetical protein
VQFKRVMADAQNGCKAFCIDKVQLVVAGFPGFSGSPALIPVWAKIFFSFFITTCKGAVNRNPGRDQAEGHTLRWHIPSPNRGDLSTSRQLARTPCPQIPE